MQLKKMSFKEFWIWFIKDKSSKAERTRRFIKLLVVLLLFALLFFMVPIEQVADALFSADLVNVIIGMALGLISVVLTAAQLEPLTRNQGIHHNLFKIIAINLAVKFYVNFLPTTLVASGYRWHRLSQPDGKVVESLAALGYFRVLETFLTLALGLSFFLLAGEQDGMQVSVAWLILILFIILISLLVITRHGLSIYRKFRFMDNSAPGQRFLQEDYPKN